MRADGLRYDSEQILTIRPEFPRCCNSIHLLDGLTAKLQNLASLANLAASTAILAFINCDQKAEAHARVIAHDAR